MKPSVKQQASSQTAGSNKVRGEFDPHTFPQMAQQNKGSEPQFKGIISHLIQFHNSKGGYLATQTYFTLMIYGKTKTLNQGGVMIRKMLCLFALLILAAAASAQAPNFDYPYLMSAPEGLIVENNYYDIPTFGDWDSDGDQDMMVGVFYSGNIFYYQNTAGAGVPPVFANHTMLLADGSPISVTYG